ncbi:MAG TPA: LLM class flavin-dependent oxidoreductase [Stellaceae bacterium]|nr:LLM class flavin-dependent oxidoreductase [Stellaceae bacterium]
MRIGAMIRLGPGSEPQGRLLYRITDYARRIEAAGFPGIWVGDSLGRGRPTLDPLMGLTAVAAATRRDGYGCFRR